MKLPKRISTILKRKQAFIDSQRDKMEATVVRLQSQLFSDIIAKLIPELDVKDGVIQETAKNYRLMSILDKTYNEFAVGANTKILAQITAGTAKIADMSQGYYKAIFRDMPATFEQIIAKTDKLINLRIGLDGGKLVRGGYIESVFKNNTIGAELKELTSKAVTSGMDMREYVKALRNKVVGVDKKAGLMERQFQRYAYDLYQQYDAAYNRTIGNEFGFRYFAYEGGLIRDSRDFCAAHDGKVFSRDEAEEWKTWTPAKGQQARAFPAGYEIKAKDLYSVPSYMSYEGYDPLIDRGGYNCRHHLGWLPDELAFDMRPDLKK